MFRAARHAKQRRLARVIPGFLLYGGLALAILLGLETVTLWDCNAERGFVRNVLERVLECCASIFPAQLSPEREYREELLCNLERARIVYLIDAFVGSMVLVLMTLTLMVLGVPRPLRTPSESKATKNVLANFIVVVWFFACTVVALRFYINKSMFGLGLGELHYGRIPRVTAWRWTVLVDIGYAAAFFGSASILLILLYHAATKPERS